MPWKGTVSHVWSRLVHSFSLHFTPHASWRLLVCFLSWVRALRHWFLDRMLPVGAFVVLPEAFPFRPVIVLDANFRPLFRNGRNPSTVPQNPFDDFPFSLDFFGKTNLDSHPRGNVLATPLLR